MREQGIVESTEKGFAKVKVQKKEECSKCGMCLFPKGADSVTLHAVNSVNAKTGDTVVIESKSGSKLLGAILAFLVPLILILVCVLLAIFVIENEIYGLIGSVVAVAVWYLILPQIDKKLKKSKTFSAEILLVVSRKEGEEIQK